MLALFRSPSFRLCSLALGALAVIAAVASAPGRLATPSPVGGTWTWHLTDDAPLTAGATLSTPTGATYAVASVVAGKPVRWNPCSAIHWRANTARGPVGGLDVLKAAVAGISAATGTTWVYDGLTLSTPTSGWLPATPTSTRPVLLGWTDGAASDLLRNAGPGVLGMTRTTWFGHVTSTGTVAATRGAVVALDRTKRLPLRGADSWSTVALHELGHVMGLAHPQDSHQLMNAMLPPGLTGLQAGDRFGLHLMGRSAGCITL